MKKNFLIAFVLALTGGNRSLRAEAMGIQVNPVPMESPDAKKGPAPAKPEEAPEPEEERKADAPVPSLEPRLQQAEQALSQGNWQEARKKCLDVLKDQKKSAPARTLLGRTYFAQKDYKEAIDQFKKALKLDPQYAEAYYWKGAAFEALGKLDEAANEYQAAFHADPQMDSAREAWQRVKEKLPKLPEG